GDLVAGLLQGGVQIGALTLTRWYALHVIFLPALLLGLVVLHIFLMRRHGISGPVRPRQGEALPFYPWQAARDTAVVSVVLVALVALAWNGAPALEGPADPSDNTYVPRPEWYFLGLFQLLKYFPGKWEVVGTMIIPGVVAVLLALLPWIDRGAARDPRRRPVVIGAFVLGLAAVAALTTLGWMDRPRPPAGGQANAGWTLRELGGRTFVERGRCATCHAEDGLSEPLEMMPSTRGPEWLAGHVADPEMIAPGLREPPVAVGERESAAIVAYVRKLSRASYPSIDPATQTAAAVYARHCIGCHVVDGDGGDEGPELSTIGSARDAAFLKRLIADPESVKADAEMPSFDRRLSPAELDAIAAYLANRK
ncbi:MAG: cytochrome b N-terminal domain-containing protein, partial [Acidobacteriota bacterium]|nr:cytochrome b N-terminal domain-containing protein [Acidobacteriota bacterium]